jgi:hypothetical protein
MTMPSFASIIFSSAQHNNQQTPGANGWGGWEQTKAMGNDDQCGRRWTQRQQLWNKQPMWEDMDTTTTTMKR